jgi:hypothetical protein
MRIPFPPLRNNDQPDPDEQFRAFNEEDLAPRARLVLARMRCQNKPFDGQCDECPGGSHPRCTRNLDYWLQQLDEQ